MDSQRWLLVSSYVPSNWSIQLLSNRFYWGWCRNWSCCCCTWSGLSWRSSLSCSRSGNGLSPLYRWFMALGLRKLWSDAAYWSDGDPCLSRDPPVFPWQNACTRSVTKAGPMSDPVQTLEHIIEEWWDLEIEEHDQSWKLSSVNRACTWSPNKDLSYPAYVLTRMGNPFHLLRPHGVFEVVWGYRQWVTAIALPKWINNYHCLGLFTQVCRPMLASSCAMWCDDTRLSEELIECNIGSFVQVHIETLLSDLVRIDLQALSLLLPLSPSPPAFLLRFSSPPPLLSLKVFAQSGSAQRGSTITQSGCLRPCRTPLAWCCLWSSAIIVRCFYVPPTILVPPMLMDAVDHLMHLCLLALSLLLQVAFLVSSPPFHKRGGLSGASLWHIVRHVLQCSSPPLIYPAWVLPSPHYDPSMISLPLFLWATPDWSACGILSGLSSGSSSLIFPHLLPYLYPILLQSSLAPHQASWYFVKSPPSWTSLTSSPPPCPLTLIL